MLFQLCYCDPLLRWFLRFFPTKTRGPTFSKPRMKLPNYWTIISSWRKGWLVCLFVCLIQWFICRSAMELEWSEYVTVGQTDWPLSFREVVLKIGRQPTNMSQVMQWSLISLPISFFFVGTQHVFFALQEAFRRSYCPVGKQTENDWRRPGRVVDVSKIVALSRAHLLLRGH